MSNSTDNSLQALYPFLHGDKKDAASENAALLESIRQKSQHSLDIKQQFFANNGQALIETARAVARVYLNKGRIFTMGNGGSSCDAAHFAVEFQHPVTTGRPALPAMNLCVDTAMISAVSNDIGVQHIFVRQLNAHARAGDGVVGFSTSGNSDNLMAGYRKARELGLVCIGFAGGTGNNMGGEMKNSGLLDHCLVVETDSIHRVQEVHVACYHILWDLVHTLLADQRGRLAEDPNSRTNSHNEETLS
ncbi:MAG TPA: SIS domain-containing protein [Chromatiales bacterium]|nr:SIS domain-containing protein [Chromatiales bacterium]